MSDIHVIYSIQGVRNERTSTREMGQILLTYALFSFIDVCSSLHLHQKGDF